MMIFFYLVMGVVVWNYLLTHGSALYRPQGAI